MENQNTKGMFCRLRDKQKLKYMLDKNFVNNAYFILAKFYYSEIYYPSNYL